MQLKQILSDFCRDEKIEDLQCIIHLALLNYVANLSKAQKEVSLSPKVISGFTGLCEDQSIKLLEIFAEKNEFIKKYYVFKCLEDSLQFAVSINEDEIDDKTNIVIENCQNCNTSHQYNLDTDDKHLFLFGFSANKSEVIKELKVTGEEFMSNLFVLNTDDSHLDRLATILVSKLKAKDSDKEIAKKGIIKYLHTIKDFTGVIASISSDGATTTKNIKNMLEDLSGFSSIKDSFVELFKS